MPWNAYTDAVGQPSMIRHIPHKRAMLQRIATGHRYRSTKRALRTQSSFSCSYKPACAPELQVCRRTAAATAAFRLPSPEPQDPTHPCRRKIGRATTCWSAAERHADSAGLGKCRQSSGSSKGGHFHSRQPQLRVSVAPPPSRPDCQEGCALPRVAVATGGAQPALDAREARSSRGQQDGAEREALRAARWRSGKLQGALSYELRNGS